MRQKTDAPEAVAGNSVLVNELQEGAALLSARVEVQGKMLFTLKNQNTAILSRIQRAAPSLQHFDADLPP